MQRRLIGCLGIWALLAAGCGSDSSEPAEAIWCGGLCKAVARCGFQDPTCQSRCEQQNPALAARSASGASAEEPCLEQLSCVAIGGDDTAWNTELDACWKQAVASVAVTAHVRRFCPGHAMMWFDCGYTLSVDDCEHEYSMWNDAIVNEIALCDAKPSCEEFQACEQNVFDNL